MIYAGKTMNHPDFELVRHALRASSSDQRGQSYRIPEFLRYNGSRATRLVDLDNPYTFFADLFDRILADSQSGGGVRGIGCGDRVYQSFPRTFASLNGRIGTALTQIAFLPFLRDALGITIFVCLPTGQIGRTNRKGSRGSPFAVRDPFNIDPSFGDPLLPDIPVLVQYRALIQACDLLGIRAGSIVPMSTLAIDSPLFATVPALGFWWQAEPGELVHCASTEQGAHYEPNLSMPNIDTRTASRFVPAPSAAAVTTVQGQAGQYHVVQDSLDSEATVTLANAFPDVLAGNASTYTWGDVATVRYTHSVIPTPAGTRNVAAFDPDRPAWGLMPALLAWRYHELGERVFLIDVSPSVPPELLRRARELAGAWHPDLADRLRCLGAGRLTPREAERLLCDLRRSTISGGRCPIEDMTFIGEELWEFGTPDTEFDAVCGPLTYCVSAHTHNVAVLVRSLAHHLRLLEHHATESPYFAGVGNHDTMPALPWASKLLQVMYGFLPGAVPLIFSGTEWGASLVTNKEFGFDTTPQLLCMRERLDDQVLALFNDVPLDWQAVTADGCQIELAGRLMDALEQLDDLERWRYATLFPDPDLAPSCFGYSRSAPEQQNSSIIVLANWATAPATVRWPAASACPILTVPCDWRPAFLRAGELVTLPARSAVVARTDHLDW